MAPSNELEVSSAIHNEPPVDHTKSKGAPMDLDQLESETLDILERFGSPGSRSLRRIGPAVSYPPKRVESARPWTGASSIINRRHCRTTGGMTKTAKKVTDLRPFTSSNRKQVQAKEHLEISINDDCKMFKADGTARNALRDTISSALSTSQFDSVPCLLASGKHKSELPKSCDGQPILNRSSPFLRETSSPYFVSTMSKNRSMQKKPTRGQGLAEENRDPSKPKSLALRDIKYTGFDKAPNVSTATVNEEERKDASENAILDQNKEVCFNCWSAGEGNKCLIHTEKLSSTAPGQNLSMCENWNGTQYLRSKYRSEEIQEQRKERQESLVFDRSQKEFSTLEQPKHPIYRLVAQHIARFNFTYQRRQKVQTWFRSFISKLKDGGFQGKRSNASAQILLLRGTVRNMISVQKLSIEVKDLHPKAPVTGTTMRERLGQEQVLVEKVFTVNGSKKTINCIVAGPTPVPKCLYRARKYEPLPPTTFVLRDAVEAPDGRLDFSSIMSSSVQYAKFGQKRANENIAVGGLSTQMIVSQRFTGRFPPQYKDFTCNYSTVLVPPPNDNVKSPPTIEVPPGKLPYIHRELVTPINTRLPPTVMVKTGLSPDDRHFFGVNRPEQTGEEGDVGFRTSTWYSMPSIDASIDTKAFRPSLEVASPNTPVHSALRTMKVDETYPFRKEQSRQNCVEDLYHLLLSDGSCSSNKLQMFTCVGSQQCGYFMQNGNSSLPIGRVVTRIVRSWAFLQSESEESAIYDEEVTSLGLGGVVLKNRPRHAESMPSGVLMKNSRKQVREAILRRMPEGNGSPEDSFVQEHNSLLEPPLMEQKALQRETAISKGTVRKRTAANENEPNIIETEEEITKSSEERRESDVLPYTNKPEPFSKSQPPNIKEKVQGEQPNNAPITESTMKKDNALVAESISQVIGQTLKSFSSNPEDLIRLGMGIGTSLGAQGFLSLGQGAEQEKIENEPSPDEEKVEALQRSGSGGRSSYDVELTGIDNITVESCISEESKLDSEEIIDNVGVDENNIVNFSDFNVSPKGLTNVISSTRAGAKRVEYLSYTFSLNLPSPRSIETLKPRSMAEEWRELQYNPWSDGREPTSSTFVRSLKHETKHWPKPNNRSDAPEVSNTAREFAALCTLCRHGKYRELEETINSPSWSLPIDYCDDAGNTLLMIACQNGNRRIAKLCLRRGSQINNQNLNGNSCLHFAFGYGFDELGEYLISKGGDDSLQNAHGLTCYEGLDMDEL